MSLCFREHPAPLEADAVVAEISGDNALLLDVTPFYAQGGGQPSDTGSISTASGGVWTVVAVRKTDAGIQHTVKESLEAAAVGQRVRCTVDAARRRLHCVLHSGGHLVDAAVARLGWPLKPSKAYHFPEGPYVEYAIAGGGGEWDLERLQGTMQELIGASLPIRLLFQSRSAIKHREILEAIPETMQEARLIEIEGFVPVPCGGTHCLHTGELAGIVVKKVKQTGDRLRVSYALQQ